MFEAKNEFCTNLYTGLGRHSLAWVSRMALLVCLHTLRPDHPWILNGSIESHVLSWSKETRNMTALKGEMACLMLATECTEPLALDCG